MNCECKLKSSKVNWRQYASHPLKNQISYMDNLLREFEDYWIMFCSRYKIGQEFKVEGVAAYNIKNHGGIDSR